MGKESMEYGNLLHCIAISYFRLKENENFL
jgi:hypothetical protein